MSIISIKFALVIIQNMTKVPSFYLKNPKSDNSLIYLAIRLNKNELFKYSTGLKIYPELFDTETQRTITDSKIINEYAKVNPQIKSEIKVINAKLSRMQLDFQSIYNTLSSISASVIPSDIRLELDKLYNGHRQKSNKSVTLNKYLESFITRCENGEVLHGGGKKYTHGTLKTYKTFLNVLNSFKARIEFNEVTLSFYSSFLTFLNNKNHSINYVGKNIKFLKVIMKDAFQNNIHNNTIYTHKDFRTPSEQSEAVYLTSEELGRLYKIDLEHKPNYALARDVFLIGCYTALRYSDYSRISETNIKERNGVKYLEIYTRKTNELVKIPLKPLVFNILKKYNFNLPKTYEQKVNKYIKEVCKMVGIIENVEIKQTTGGIVKTRFKPKYELVKTHTARRTGATLLFLADVTPIDIMKITGHKKSSNLLKYICVSKEQTAERLSSNSFFQ